MLQKETSQVKSEEGLMQSETLITRASRQGVFSSYSLTHCSNFP